VEGTQGEGRSQNQRGYHFSSSVKGHAMLIVALGGGRLRHLRSQTDVKVTSGVRQMKAIVRTGMLLTLFCMPMLALSNATAWARHYRVDVYRTSEWPCPGRCNGTRLSICSACLGVRTCAQTHFCTNNPAITCGGESTVSVPCWNPW